MQDAKRLSQLNGISGFAIVVWNRDCTSDCGWRSTPPMIPGLVVPEFVKQTILREMSATDTHKIIDQRTMGK